MSWSSEQLDDRANISFVDYVDSLRIPYEDIELATNNFGDTNLLTIQSPSSSSFQKLIYKGQIEQSDGQLIDIVTRRLLEVQDNIVFNELLTSYLLTHKHILRVFKISGTDDPIIINKYEVNESLDKHLSDSDLTWIQRLHICVGVAHALSYIHDFDAKGDFSVIHGNIKSSKILLDKFWEPKLNCFGFSMFVKKHQPHLTSKYNGAVQYVDPEYEITEGLTHKSDVFSFGVVLFEVLFGEIASVKDEDNWYFAKLARSTYENKRLGDKINIDLQKQMDPQSLDIFSETAYCCLKEASSQRPNMVQIVKDLEASLELQQNHESLMNFESNTDDAPMKVDLIVDHASTASEIKMNFESNTDDALMKVNIIVDDAPTVPETEIMSFPNHQFAHLRIPLENILSATNNFAQENVTCNGGFVKEYKGQLLWSSELNDITARRLNKERKDAEQQFWMEISMLSSLKHKNLVSLVGFCDEKDEKIIIYRREIRGSLNNYLSDATLMTWVQRLEICVGLAHALSYIHYDEPRDFSVIHRAIDSSRILLNDEWEPKLCGFEFSMKIKTSQRHHSFHTYTSKYVNGSGDPAYIETKSVNHKSDMYSFGIVMYEVLCGRKSIIDDEDNRYLAPLAVTHYREKILDEIIDWDLWKQMDSQSFDIFTKVAYDCLNEERPRRPNIDEIVTRLEKALELQLEHRNANHEAADSTTTIRRHQYQKLEDIAIPLEEIMLATSAFSHNSQIGDGGFGVVYKGRLSEHWQNHEVAITRLSKTGHQGKEFLNEVTLISRFHHQNIIPFIGYCDEGDEMILVYEYANNGSIDNHLENTTRRRDLTWVKRLQICLGAAKGLNYLHSGLGEENKVIHGDVKSGNILLDENMEAKICDFGLSNVAGTNYYMDPIYHENGILRTESDVYSFGVVMFEMLCGMPAYHRRKIGDGKLQPMIKLVRQYYNYGKELLIDPLIKDQIDNNSLQMFIETAYLCISFNSKDRPSMKTVADKIEEALDLQVKTEV